MELTGKTALVTGGSRGLGLQIAEALGEAGARIVLSSRKSADLEQAREHLASRNPTGKVLKREIRAQYWKSRDRQVN